MACRGLSGAGSAASMVLAVKSREEFVRMGKASRVRGSTWLKTVWLREGNRMVRREVRISQSQYEKERPREHHR